MGLTPADAYSEMLRVLLFLGQREREAAEAAIGHSSGTGARGGIHQGGSGGGGISMLSMGRDLAPFKDVQVWDQCGDQCN